MLTRCPTCTTTFRVTPEQLKARLGRVRCGQCQAVFNALDSLLEEAAVLPSAPPPSAADVEQQVQEILMPRRHEEVAAPFAETSFPSAAAPIAVAAAELPALPQEPVVVAEFSRAREAGAPDSAEQSPALTEEKTVATLTPADLETPPEAEPAIEPEPALLPPTAINLVSHELTEIAIEAAHSEAANEPLAEVSTDIASPAFATAVTVTIDEARAETDAPHRGGRWPWLIGISLGFLGLLLQLTLHYRAELATLNPGLKPALQALCRPIDCSVPLPHKIDLLSIETSDLHPAPQKGQLLLVATLKNKAPFAQELPLLEVTLTDVADRVLIIKALQPAEYLPTDFKAAAGFPARKEIGVNLTLDAGDLPAAGYRLYLYHP